MKTPLTRWENHDYVSAQNAYVYICIYIHTWQRVYICTWTWPGATDSETKQRRQEHCSDQLSKEKKLSDIHAPAILGHRVHASHEDSSFHDSRAMELWAEPCVVPSDLSLQCNMDATAKSELWAEPCVVPSDLSLQCNVDTPPKSELWAEPCVVPSDLSLQCNVETPHLLSHFESFSRSLDLSLSPIQKTQELAWAPE